MPWVRLMFEAGQMSGPQWRPLARELAVEFLKPLYYGEAGTHSARGRHGMLNVPGDVASKGLRELSHKFVVEFSAAWQNPRARLKEEIAGRLLQVEAESLRSRSTTASISLASDSLPPAVSSS